MKTDPTLEMVHDLVRLINAAIERMPVSDQADARKQVMETLATMPTEQGKQKLMEILEPGFAQMQGRA